METSAFVSQFIRARKCSVPVVSINTPDAGATIKEVAKAVNGGKVKVAWDFVRGYVGIGEDGQAWVSGAETDAKADPVAALTTALKLPAGGLLFFHLANRWMVDGAVVQAVWNIRDEFKADGRTLVLLAKNLDIPAELSDDVVVFDEALPSAERLTEIIREQHKNAGLEATAETEGKAIEALRGLSAFSAEQLTAMSLRKEGLDTDSLWERKRKTVEQTPGLKVYRDGDKFSDVGGCDVVKGFLSRIMQGEGRPNAIIFLDELEKCIGSKGDQSGVSQDQLGTLLSYMQDNQATGMIFIGPPGAAKSAIAKAAGNEGGIPTVQLDLGAAKGSLVGQSEQQIRAALKVITAVSNGKALFIATCNSIADLPPELRRRFTLGTFFFDLPTAEERAKIWSIWKAKYNVSASKGETPNDDQWTGAEIKQCCDIAWRCGVDLKDAAAFVVPVAKAAAGKINALRTEASGKFLSASHPGVYEVERAPEKTTARKIEL